MSREHPAKAPPCGSSWEGLESLPRGARPGLAAPAAGSCELRSCRQRLFGAHRPGSKGGPLEMGTGRRGLRGRGGFVRPPGVSSVCVRGSGGAGLTLGRRWHELGGCPGASDPHIPRFSQGTNSAPLYWPQFKTRSYKFSRLWLTKHIPFALIIRSYIFKVIHIFYSKGQVCKNTVIPK